jgi:Lipid A 3-O-deacylase (PagL)
MPVSLRIGGMRLPVVHMRIHTIIHAVSLALLTMAGCVPGFANAQPLCESCEVQVGLGGTYHFWGTTGGVVLPVTVNWSGGRYELGLFRISTPQVIYDTKYPGGRLPLAHPYWAMSMSRRWQLIERGPIHVFAGFGLAARTESDELSATRLDFASQLGMRFRFPGNRAVAELTVRHWSNAGIRLPNHGQDFATLTVRLNWGDFGVDRADLITPNELVNSKAALVAANYRIEGTP